MVSAYNLFDCYETGVPGGRVSGSYPWEKSIGTGQKTHAEVATEVHSSSQADGTLFLCR